MARSKVRPTNIVLTHDCLSVVWSDGTSMQAPLSDLRRSCPCAVCREAREEKHGIVRGTELPLISTESMAATADAVSFDYVGRYGVRINWADGHNAGIYTFEVLREFGTA